MGELFESGETDVPVWSLDDNLRYVRRHLTHVFSTGRKQVLQLTTSSGKTIRATANHPFLTYDGFRPLGELRRVTASRCRDTCRRPDRMTVWEDEKVTLLAHLIGDGSFVKRQPLRYAIDRRGEPPRGDDGRAALRRRRRARRVPGRPVHDAAAARAVPLTHGKRNPIAAWLDELGLFGLRSHEKFVPRAGVLPAEEADRLVPSAPVGHRRFGHGEQERSRWPGLLRLDQSRACRRRLPTAAALRDLLPHPPGAEGGYRDGWTLDICGCDDQRRFLEEIGVHGARGEAAERLLEIVRGLSGEHQRGHGPDAGVGARSRGPGRAAA